MRVGIVTQPLRNNYGGLLQNWALQQVLVRLGHEPITLNYENCIKLPPLYRQLLSHVKTLVLWFSRTRRRSFIKFERFNRSAASQKFVDENIRVSTPFVAYTNNLIRKNNLECVITGSDQVWRPIYNRGYVDKMFLSFVKDNVQKIAYAASFGVSDWEYSDEEEELCRPCARKIDAISVRENSGVTLCEKYLGVDAAHVLDPTLLLHREDYDELTGVVPKAKEPYMLAYILDQAHNSRERIDGLGKSLNLPVKIVGADGDMKIPVEEWIAMFRDAAFVVTNSFHGTVFSIIYHKSFVALYHEGRGGDRFTDLLGQVGLKQRLLTRIPENVEGGEHIDWEKIEQTLEARRQFSTSWLRDNLKSNI